MKNSSPATILAPVLPQFGQRISPSCGLYFVKQAMHCISASHMPKVQLGRFRNRAFGDLVPIELNRFIAVGGDLTDYKIEIRDPLCVLLTAF